MKTRSTQLVRFGSITLGLALAATGSHAFAASADQNVNVSVPGASIKASSSGGVDMNVGGIKINANQNGAQVQVQEGGNSVNVDASNAGATVTLVGAPVSVQSDADFTAYVAQMKQHSAITDVQSTPQQLTISYVQPATIFGFMPLSLPAQVVVSANGDVKVHLPWYSFLTNNNSAAVSAALKQDTHVTGNTAGLNDSAQAWAVYDTSNVVAGS